MPSRGNALRKSPREILFQHLPENTVDTICDWINTYAFNLKISKARNTKLGDYRSPFGGKGHRITVNHDLNKYAFLITLVHEVAHLVTWEKHKDRVAPHGKEWKLSFKSLMIPFLNENVFPKDVLDAVTGYMHNPAAASCTDMHLYRTLRKYDENTAKQGSMLVESLPADSIFQLKNGMILRKGELLRKRFKCTEMKSRKVYLVNPLAEAIQLQQEEEKGQLALFRS